MVIVGVGVTAVLELLAAGSLSNATGTELTTAVNLANNIHEISIGMAFTDAGNPTSASTKEGGGVTAYNDLWDLNGDTYSPPLDVQRHPIAGYTNWAQQVTVATVDPNNVNSTHSGWTDPTQPTARVSVTITHNGKFIYSASWLVTAPNN